MERCDGRYNSWNTNEFMVKKSAVQQTALSSAGGHSTPREAAKRSISKNIMKKIPIEYIAMNIARMNTSGFAFLRNLLSLLSLLLCEPDFIS